MPDPVIPITRYPNRRFYDRSESRYVSLPEIEEMVRSGKHIEIRDSQTDEDLTAVTLTRIIMERQPEKMELFPVDMLHFILRSKGVMSDFLRDYFRHSLPYLDYFQKHSSAAINLVQPMHWVKAWLDNIAPRPAAAAVPPPPEPPPADPAILAQRVAELEARLRQLESTGNEPEPKKN